MHPVPDEMIRLARELADRHGALLIIDEIQTGLARTGPLFAYQDVGVTPDVMCLAKSLGGGVPIGALVAAPQFDAVLQPGDHGSTFAGSPLACAAALASCAVLGDAELQQSVRVKGAALLAGLEGLVEDGLATEARGRGLMCAIDLPRPRAAEAVDGAARARASSSTTPPPRTVRMLPPLVIDVEDLDALVAALREGPARALSPGAGVAPRHSKGSASRGFRRGPTGREDRREDARDDGEHQEDDQRADRQGEVDALVLEALREDPGEEDADDDAEDAADDGGDDALVAHHRRIWRRVVPIARSIPISRVRS